MAQAAPHAADKLRWLVLALVSLFFLIGGVCHFICTAYFISIMPPYLPWPRTLVYLSGAFEVLGAIALWAPATRRLAGIGLIALALAVWPANIHMAINPDAFPAIPVWALYLRVPLQLLIIAAIAYAAGLRLRPLAAPASRG